MHQKIIINFPASDFNLNPHHTARQTRILQKIPLKISIADDVLDITCSTSKGKINDTVSVEKIGSDIEIGFNHRYLLEALRNCEDEVVKLELSNPKGACFIKPTENNDYIYMLLPVRLYEE